MAKPPRSPRESAVRGLTWTIRGLGGFLVLAVGTALGLLVLVPVDNLPSPSTAQTAQLQGSLLFLSLLLLVLATISGLMYAVGLAGLYGPRRELGRVHAASVEQTRLWLGVTLVLLATTPFVPTVTGPLLTFPGVGYVPPSWAWSASVVLAGLRAIFAGLTLFYAVQGLAQEDERVRLLVGMTLGTAGAIVWSGLAAYAEGVGSLSLASLLPFLAGVVAGLGTSAISLGLFLLVYRDVRRGLAAAGPSRA